MIVPVKTSAMKRAGVEMKPTASFTYAIGIVVGPGSGTLIVAGSVSSTPSTAIAAASAAPSLVTRPKCCEEEPHCRQREGQEPEVQGELTFVFSQAAGLRCSRGCVAEDGVVGRREQQHVCPGRERDVVDRTVELRRDLALLQLECERDRQRQQHQHDGE